MKHLLLSASLALFLLPSAVRADDGGNNGGDDGDHRRISATEMSVLGTSLAVALGACGYLLLRRKTSARS